MDCIIHKIHKLIGKKWTLLILQEMYHNEKNSFNKIKGRVKHITSKILAQRLTELETMGIIRKEVVRLVPFITEYTLTTKGKDLFDIFNKVKEWGTKYKLTPQHCITQNCTECLLVHAVKWH